MLRDLPRLILTLVAVTVAAAALLGAVDLITAPAIAMRQEEDYRNALEEYFPGMADFSSESVGEKSFDLVYDANGELLGVMASTAAQGYDDLISYNLALDKEGSILGLRIVEHSETQGVGDVIEKPEFQDQFLGKSCLDPLQIGEDIDTVSGATISTRAMIESVRQLLAAVAADFLDLEKEDPLDITALPDGTYRGSGKGYSAKIRVAVTLKGGRIKAIEIEEHQEKDTYLVEAVDLVKPQIIEGQTLEVDTQTGATESAAAIVSAVESALKKAQKSKDEKGGEK